MLEQLKAFFYRVSVSNIYIYALVRNSISKLSFLLPHDPDFYAFRKVGGGQHVFLDVGANDGVSARAYRKLVPNRPIVSIEPNPHHEPSLKKVKKSINDFTYHLIGAGDKEGQFVLYTPIYKGVPLTNYASLDIETARKNLDRHMNIRNIGKNAEFLRNDVVIKKLDELNLDPAIIKIDVEGFEDNVITGLAETIKKSRPMIMVEHNHRSYSAIKAMLTAQDYTVNAYDVPTDKFIEFPEAEPVLNVFFLPKEAHYCH